MLYVNTECVCKYRLNYCIKDFYPPPYRIMTVRHSYHIIYTTLDLSFLLPENHKIGTMYVMDLKKPSDQKFSTSQKDGFLRK